MKGKRGLEVRDYCVGGSLMGNLFYITSEDELILEFYYYLKK